MFTSLLKYTRRPLGLEIKSGIGLWDAYGGTIESWDLVTIQSMIN
jgi:hypothetical protein